MDRGFTVYVLVHLGTTISVDNAYMKFCNPCLVISVFWTLQCPSRFFKNVNIFSYILKYFKSVIKLIYIHSWQTSCLWIMYFSLSQYIALLNYVNMSSLCPSVTTTLHTYYSCCLMVWLILSLCKCWNTVLSPHTDFLSVSCYLKISKVIE
jgi:hypothetical protein